VKFAFEIAQRWVL